MGKNKLKKFAEMEEIPFVLQYPWGRLQHEDFPYRGRWGEFFGNGNPITLELGCGKGEYTVGLAKRFPDRNFIGIDIKGARMWTGAKEALGADMKNVAFLRTDIEMLPRFFQAEEVNEIWITFPDPQMQKPRKRLTGTRMLEIYRKVLDPEGRINLKTDSPFLYAYTRLAVQYNGLPVFADFGDVYGRGEDDLLTTIRTHYEQQWLSRGMTIRFLSFSPFNGKVLEEPPGAEEIEKDTYRSYPRFDANLTIDK